MTGSGSACASLSYCHYSYPSGSQDNHTEVTVEQVSKRRWKQ